MVRDFLKSEYIGSPILKVRIATSSKSPTILLKSSQYLSKYVFRDSPSLIAIESRQSKGLGTLLHVTSQALKALVNSSYDLMDPSFNLSNHLMAMGSRLERKTLHMKASFLERMAIL